MKIISLFSRRGAAFIGVPMGFASRLIAIDCDLHGESDGEAIAWYEEMFAEPPATLIHSTPRGGCHLIYRMPDGDAIRNSAGKLAAGVDVRGEGGYVIAPPSPGYSIIDDQPPGEMPEWLRVACLRPEREQTTPTPGPPPRTRRQMIASMPRQR